MLSDYCVISMWVSCE